MNDQVVGWNSETWSYKVKCAGCGRIFDAKRRSRKTCGDACRKRLSRADDHRQAALEELLMMAGRIDRICSSWPESQEVLDQVQLLAASARASAAKIRPPWRPQSLPL